MKSIFDQWYDENYQKHLKHHAAYWKCKQTWLAAQKQQLEELETLRQRVQGLEKERDELLAALHNIRALNPMLEILDERRRLFVISNGLEIKYLPVYADQPDPTYVVKWVWEVRDRQGASVAEAHEWLYQAIDNAAIRAME